MVRHGITSAYVLSALLLLTASASASASGTPAKPIAVSASKSKPAAAKAPEAKVSGKKAPGVKAEAARESIGDAFISQNTLRVYLGRPATVTLHNARGQLLFQVESSRPMEALPLGGVTTGFLYLTLRAGPLELTKKLVYSGK